MLQGMLAPLPGETIHSLQAQRQIIPGWSNVHVLHIALGLSVYAENEALYCMEIKCGAEHTR